MPLMNIFEPLFLLLVLVTIVTLVMTAVLAARGQRARALRLFGRLTLGALGYFGIVIAVSIFKPQRVFSIGDQQCFDDWCVEATGAHWTGVPQNAPYEVTLRLANRARRVPMGEKGTVVYLTDADGHRYDPLSSADEAAFDTILQPGASITTTRRFDVPANTPGLSLIYTHQGGFPIGWLIISEGGWFQKPPIVRLD